MRLPRRVSIQPEAVEEITAAVRWYAARGTALGTGFREDLRACLTRIRDHPEAYQTVRGDARRASLRRFPYSVIYLVDEETVMVLACFHPSRDPGEWERRVPAAEADLRPRETE